MNFLERLALKPHFAFTKRPETAGGNDAEFLTWEDQRSQMLDIWSHKGSGAKVPEWLDSAETLRAHFEQVFGALQEQLPAGAAAEGDDVQALAGEASEPLAGAFEASGAEILELLPPDPPFAPLFTDIPFATG